jgi:hypothetical protein
MVKHNYIIIQDIKYLPLVYMISCILFCISARASFDNSAPIWLLFSHLILLLAIGPYYITLIFIRLWRILLWASIFLVLIRSVAPYGNLVVSRSEVGYFLFILLSLYCISYVGHRFSSHDWFFCLRYLKFSGQYCFIIIYPFMLVNIFYDNAFEIISLERVRKGGSIPILVRASVIINSSVPLFYSSLLWAEESLLTSSARGLFSLTTRHAKSVSLNLLVKDIFVISAMLLPCFIHLYVVFTKGFK